MSVALISLRTSYTAIVASLSSQPTRRSPLKVSEARYRQQDCTPVQCIARRGEERVEAHVSVAPSVPTLLSLRRAKFLQTGGATVAERLACSPSTKVNRVRFPAGPPGFRKWESCRTMPLVGGFSRRSPVSPAPSFRRRTIFTSITLIGSEDPDVKSLPNLFAPLHAQARNSQWILAAPDEALTRRSNSSQRCSIVLRSGLWTGQSNRRTLLLAYHCIVVIETWHLELSSWKKVTGGVPLPRQAYRDSCRLLPPRGSNVWGYRFKNVLVIAPPLSASDESTVTDYINPRRRINVSAPFRSVGVQALIGSTNS
ncbi:hypothetical protein PR048_023814 [Dryococelus australis]|uniref:Uncharacterized protein n=1 Tax=Dryococelus australis TaxID=614101 RepID=A0ABQ9GV56_9NEOP|nr:hypothetical protein PR048_023814 [Dryococelus australis]